MKFIPTSSLETTKEPKLTRIQNWKNDIFLMISFQTISLLKELGITHVLNVAEGTGFGSCGVFDKEPYEGIILIRDIARQV